MKTGTLGGLAALVAASVLGLAINASAILVTPGDAVAFGDEGPDQGAVLAAIGEWLAGHGITCIDVNNQAYKKEVDGGAEFGSFAGNYSTTFSNTPQDPSDALIVWDGGEFIYSDCMYLWVKDGNTSPIWYLIDLAAKGWDGKDDLNIKGFWLNREGTEGRISNIGIFSGTPKDVPDGGVTAMLLGLGLLGLGGMKRAIRK